jgi:Tfp pilus assembly protein PilV
VRILLKLEPGYAVRGGCGNSARAFSLVETVVATLLLALSVVALYSAFLFGFSTIKLSQEDLRADQILVQKLETLRVYHWSKITNGYIPTDLTESFSTNGGVNYDVGIEVTPALVSESYSNTLRQVTVSLSWVSGGVIRNRSMTTFVSKDGLQTYKP